jgi:molybdate transport system regulatory protein
MNQIKDVLKVRIRLLQDDDIALGPGKVDLLEAIELTGSISQAAKKMNMSYRRAWQLVDTMNRCFSSNLVETQTGGMQGGGAVVTELGQQVIQIFRAMEIKVIQAVELEALELLSLIKNQ